MRSLAIALAAAAVLATGCGNSCQDLGERLCDCTLPGVTKATCVDSVKAEINNLNPGKDVQDVCAAKLDTCFARNDPDTGVKIDFCDWLDGRCGKSSCGLSAENYADLSDVTKNPDPDDPSRPLCPK